jgi:Concanavalin A-like lectin/glucanases superfamily/Domain of unknown function (DUF2341)
MKRIVFIFCVFTLCILTGCSRNGLVSNTGGSSSEVVGKVHYSNGQPARYAAVKLRSSDYLADTSLISSSSRMLSNPDAYTDDTGGFVLTNVPRGDYSIEVNDLMSNAVLLRCSVSDTDTVITVPVDTLKPTGSITGSIDSFSSPSVNVFVQVYGLGRITLISTSSPKFVIGDVPDGQYTIRIVSSVSANVAHKIANIKVLPGNQTELGAIELASPAQACAFSRQLVLNTSPSGANTYENVYNFPVLVRLNGNNFTFNQAMKYGEDIRFTKPDSSELQYEIERWDSAGQQAEIWVKVDTVFGNNALQYVTLRWGNSLASGRSNSAAVFDTSSGFQGVWHLAQTGNGVASDATGNHFDGISFGTNATSATQGIIGTAQEFDGSSSYIQMPGTAGSVLNFPENGHYTLSAWVYEDTLDSLNHCIFGKGHEQYYLKQKYSVVPFASWEFVDYLDKTGWQSTKGGAVSKAWKYIVGKRDGYKQYFYLDGVPVDSGYSIYGGYVSRNTGNDCTIGRFIQSVTSPSNDGFCYFKGKIDEVRVSSAALGPDWIKLCYVNQKENDGLVLFKFHL